MAHDTIAGIVERAGELAGLPFLINAKMLRHGCGMEQVIPRRIEAMKFVDAELSLSTLTLVHLTVFSRNFFQKSNRIPILGS